MVILELVKPELTTIQFKGKYGDAAFISGVVEGQGYIEMKLYDCNVTKKIYKLKISIEFDEEGKK